MDENESESNINYSNNPYASHPPKPSKKKWIFIGIGIVVIFAIIFLVLFSGNSEDSKTDLKNNSEQGGGTSLAIVDCGKTPEGFTLTDEPSLEMKKIFDCGSVSLRDCKPSITEYKSDVGDNIYLKVIGEENGKCVVRYEWGEKGAECDYPESFLKEIYNQGTKEKQEWAVSFGISFGFGMELLKYEKGKNFEQEVTNPKTGNEEKVNCKFYEVEKENGVEENGGGNEGEDEENKNNSINNEEIANNLNSSQKNNNSKEESSNNESVCGNGICEFEEKESNTCWNDCKPTELDYKPAEINTNIPIFDGNFDYKETKQCCGVNDSRGRFKLFYTCDYKNDLCNSYSCDYIGGKCKTRKGFCKERCGLAGLDYNFYVGAKVYTELQSTNMIIGCTCFEKCQGNENFSEQYWNGYDETIIKDGNKEFLLTNVKCEAKEGRFDQFSYTVDNRGNLNVTNEDLFVLEIDEKNLKDEWEILGIPFSDTGTSSSIWYSFPLDDAKNERIFKIGLSENNIFVTKIKCLNYI